MPYLLRKLKSMGQPMFDQVVYSSQAYVDLKSTLNDLSPWLIDFSQSSESEMESRIRSIAKLIYPFTSSEVNFVRVGAAGDGGYVMADDFRVQGAISIGIGKDNSWDVDIAGRGIPVAMFDPTIRRPPQSIAGSKFYRIGIAEKAKGKRMLPLEQINQIAGFAGTDDLILKVDIEGHEWNVLESLQQAELLRYRQIVVEFHNLGQIYEDQFAEQVEGVLRKLWTDHIPAHLHANNYNRIVRFGRHWFPDAVEVTYVRRDLMKFPAPALTIRKQLDCPCDSRVSDISLEGLTHLAPTLVMH